MNIYFWAMSVSQYCFHGQIFIETCVVILCKDSIECETDYFISVPIERIA